MSDWVQVAPGVYTPPNFGAELLFGVLLKGHAPETWYPVSLKRTTSNPKGLLPGAKAVMLGGISILAVGAQPGSYDITLATRKHGYALEVPYLSQAPAYPHTYMQNIGNRQPSTQIVALDSEQRFDFKFTLQHPDGSPPSNWHHNFPVVMWWGLPDLFPWA